MRKCALGRTRSCMEGWSYWEGGGSRCPGACQVPCPGSRVPGPVSTEPTCLSPTRLSSSDGGCGATEGVGLSHTQQHVSSCTSDTRPQSLVCKVGEHTTSETALKFQEQNQTATWQHIGPPTGSVKVSHQQRPRGHSACSLTLSLNCHSRPKCRTRHPHPPERQTSPPL